MIAKFPRIAAAVAALLVLVAAPERGRAQRVGVFFDEQASVCAWPIEPNFDQAHAYVFVFLPTDSVVSGLSFRVVLPALLSVVENSLTFPRRPVIQYEGDLENGLDLRFMQCVSQTEPLLVAEFDIEEESLVGPRPNLRVDLRGAVLDSMTSADEPQLRICDPSQPDGEGRGFMIAPSVDGTLNCTAGCGCTTAVAPSTWGTVKALFR